MRPDLPAAGRATLTPVPDVPARSTWSPWTNRPPGSWGIARRAGAVIGGISRARRGSGGAAYTDREHLPRGGGDVWFLPDLPSRAHAVRALAVWWWLVDNGRTEGRQPTELTPAQWRVLIR